MGERLKRRENWWAIRLKNKRTKYIKKDGSISFYATLPILQYRVGPKQRKSKRIPLNHVAEIERLLRSGVRFKALMARYGALAATTAMLPTLYIMLDGTGVPCVKKDTEGIRGKGGDGQAGTREVKVAIVGTCRRLNRHGRPIRDPGCESHLVSPRQARDFGTLLRKLANSRGYGNGTFRVQIVGDGAAWIANIVRDAFPGNTIIFTNDFYHACEYLHACVELAEADPVAVAKTYRCAKSILYRFGGASLAKHLKQRYGSLDAEHPAWGKLAYIEDRAAQMKYGEFRRQGLYIGSGPVEAACRTDVARRCKQAGMHWRHHNAAAICALSARFRSRLPAA